MHARTTVSLQTTLAGSFSDAPIEASRAAEALSIAAGAPAVPGAIVRIPCGEEAGPR